MNANLLKLLLCLSILCIPFALVPPSAEGKLVSIDKWQFKWISASNGSHMEERNDSNDWIAVDARHPVPHNPDNNTAAWLKIELPDGQATDWKQTGLFIDKLYGHHIEIFAGDRLIYDCSRDYAYDVFKIAVPLDSVDLGKTVYIKIVSLGDRIGIHKPIEIGQFEGQLARYYKNDLIDLIFGSSLLLVAAVMLMCSIFLKSQYSSWVSLAIVILTTGIMIITFSPFPYYYFDVNGKLFLALFDLSLFVFLPALAFFVEKALDCGKSSILARFRLFLTVNSAICTVLLICNEITGGRYMNIYYFCTVTLLAIVMFVQFAIIVGVSMRSAIKGNKDAGILFIGLAIFAVLSIGELVVFFVQDKNYELSVWKWGILAIFLSFIFILSRKLVGYHEQVVKHSKELELFNNRVQRHEKMEILSELAASVAHEVRNPLQVTRGFLQLLSETSEQKSKKYLALAIEELDRASGIITDFLTFAKPQLDDVTVLRLSDEFEHIEGILTPMANLQGGKIRFQIPGHLFVKGNSSKLKQAFINIIKNSIEALDGEGTIQVWAYVNGGEVAVHVKDNGDGMDQYELSRLGEPYFSSKTKGTGLGLMVTFRIIEVMQGKIEFKSVKSIGTEVIVRFPAADRAE